MNGLTLQPGQSHTCKLHNPWSSVGPYTVWPDWNYAGVNSYHQGQLGPDQIFALSADPVLAATSPLVITAPSGFHPKRPIDESFTVTNESGATLSVPALFLAVRNPRGASEDQRCAANLTLAPGQAHTCKLRKSWAVTGKYTV